MGRNRLKAIGGAEHRGEPTCFVSFSWGWRKMKPSQLLCAFACQERACFLVLNIT